jgi:hypothetical protein
MKIVENDTRKQILLNGAQLAAEMGVSPNYVYAVRRAMGLTGRSRFMQIEVVLQWLKDHPEFTIRNAYADVN